MRIQLLYAMKFLIHGFLFFVINLGGHGFDRLTQVKTKTGSNSLYRVYERICRGKIERVLTYNFTAGQCCVERRVKTAAEGEANCHCRIHFADNPNDDIVCTPSQEFYLTDEHRWAPACELKMGARLLAKHNSSVIVSGVSFIESSLSIFSIQVNENHNYFVGNLDVLTHNMMLPAVASISLSSSFGSGAAAGGTAGSYFGPIGVGAGLALGGLGGLCYWLLSKGDNDVYQAEYDIQEIRAYLKNKNKHKDREEKDDAQAPGKPTKDDGYDPPKKWNGKKVKHPKTGQYGWPDKKGNIWVPTGPGSSAHGGAHWDVQYPNGRDYDNVYPGGKIR